MSRAVVDAKEFSHAMSKISKILKKCAIPILEEVCLRIQNGRCTLTATDLETWLTAELPASGDDMFFVFRKTKDILRACSHFAGELTMEFSETRSGSKKAGKILLRCERRGAEFEVYDGADYPNMPQAPEGDAFSVSSARLSACVERVRYAAEKPSVSARPAAICVQFCGNRVYALDGTRLACDTLEGVSFPKPFLVRADVLAHLSAFGKEDNIALLLRGIKFPEGVTTNLLDPCCGCGKALRQLAQGNNCYAYGVELDESRAEEAQTRLHRVGFGSFFHSSISREAFHLLFLNPPYLSVINESGGRSRHEKRFLIESLPALAYGGLLIYVIPYYRLTPDICRILVDNFDDLSVWRFTESEFRKFKQVAVLGIRKPRGTELQDTLWLEELASAPMSIRSLAEMPEERYALPDHPIEVNTFKGERFNQKELEQQLRRCNSFAQMMARSELDSGVKRPLLPLSISQIGLIGGSGMINGLIACDTPHIIKGRIVKVIRTESEEKFSAQGNHIGSEVKETITNKMIFNVLTPNGFKALT